MANPFDTDEPQKEGDTLILAGEFTGGPVDPTFWEGATAALNVAVPDSETGELVIDHDDVTIDLTPLSLGKVPRYSYAKATMPPRGKYRYEIEVTTPALPAPVTWPNDKTKHVLRVIPQLG